MPDTPPEKPDVLPMSKTETKTDPLLESYRLQAIAGAIPYELYRLLCIASERRAA